VSASLTVIWWRNIPAQVVAKGEGSNHLDRLDPAVVGGLDLRRWVETRRLRLEHRHEKAPEGLAGGPTPTVGGGRAPRCC
jgi:hypothetical protein